MSESVDPHAVSELVHRLAERGRYPHVYWDEQIRELLRSGLCRDLDAIRRICETAEAYNVGPCWLAKVSSDLGE